MKGKTYTGDAGMNSLALQACNHFSSGNRWNCVSKYLYLFLFGEDFQSDINHLTVIDVAHIENIAYVLALCKSKAIAISLRKCATFFFLT